MKNWRAEVDVTVPFHDVDMMGFCWHGHYVRYFEMARSELFDHIDYNYEQMRESGYAWPVIELHIRYPQPLHFRQAISVSASLIEYENRLKIDYLIADKSTGRRLTKGHTVQVAVDMRKQEMCFVSPPILLKKLGIEKPDQ